LVNRTLPSANTTLTLPEWKLRTALNEAVLF
jgi:hypothetical protein